MIYFSIDGGFGDATDLITVEFDWWNALPEDVKGNINDLPDNARYDYVEHLVKSPEDHENGFDDCDSCAIHLN